MADQNDQMNSLLGQGAETTPLTRFTKEDFLPRREQFLKDNAPKVVEEEVTVEEVKIPFTDIRLGGIGFATDRKLRVTNPKEAFKDVNVSIREVYDNVDSEEFAKEFGKVRYFATSGDKDAEKYPVYSAQDTNARLNAADSVGATHLIMEDSDINNPRTWRPIPWTKAVSSRITVPERMVIAREFAETRGKQPIDPFSPRPIDRAFSEFAFDTKEEMSVENMRALRSGYYFLTGYSLMPDRLFGDTELPDSLMGMHVNDRLLAAGINDARTRASILEQHLKSPFYGDVEKLIRNSTETVVKGAMELGIYAAGETLDLTDVLVKKALGPFGLIQTEATIAGDSIGMLMEPDTGYLRDAASRQSFMDDLWKPFPYELQERFLEGGADVSLREAERIARVYSGAPAKLGQIYLEFKIPTTILNKYSFLKATDEGQRFSKWAENQAKTPDFDGNMENLVEKWIKVRPDIVGGRKTGKFKSNIIRQRIIRNIQNIDATLPEAERAPVVQSVERLTSLHTRLDTVNAKLRRGNGNPKLLDQKETIEGQIFNENMHLRTVQKTSSIPQWIRQGNVQDRYFIGGAVAANQLFESLDSDIDPQLAELLGMITGGILYGTKGVRRTLYDWTTRNTIYRKDTIKQAEIYLQRIFDSSPETQLRWNARTKIIAEKQQELVEAGIDPDLLAIGVPIIADYAALRKVQQTAVDTLNVSESKNLDYINDIQANLDSQKVLYSELQELLSGTTGLEPDDAFVRLISDVEADMASNIDFVQRLLTKEREEGVAFYLDAAKQNTRGLLNEASPSVTNPELAMSYPETMTQLFVGGLLDTTAIPADEFASRILSAEDRINDTLQVLNQKIYSKLGDVDTAKRVSEGRIPKYGEESIVNVDSAGGVLAFQLETKHVGDNLKARRIFMMLDPRNRKPGETLAFRVKGGQELPSEVKPVVDVADLFENLLMTDEIPGMGAITAIQAVRGDVALTAGQVTKIDTLVQKLTDPYFSLLAERQGIDVQEAIVDMAMELGVDVRGPKGPQLQRKVAQALLKDTNLSFFKMTPDELIEFDRTIRSLAYGAKNPIARNTMLSTAELVDSKFSQFTVDGKTVDQLEVFFPDANRYVDLNYLINLGKEDYRAYKEIYYDNVNVSSTYGGAVIPSLMSWNTRTKQLGGGTAENPTGVAYTKNVREWLNPGVVQSFLNSPDEAKLFFSAMQNSIGDKKPFVFDNSNTLVFEQTMKTAIAEYLVSKSGTFNTRELSAQFRELQNVFVKIDADGNEVPMFEIGRVIDDVFGVTEETVGKDTIRVVRNQRDKDVRKALDTATLPAQRLSAAMKEAASIIQKQGAGNVKIGEVGDFLIDGGLLRVEQLRSSLLQTRGPGQTANYTAQEVDTIIKEAVTASVARRSFINTDKTVIVNGNQFTEQVVNLAEMQRYMGLSDNNIERQRFLQEVLGEKRWNHYRATSSFLAELENDPLAYRAAIRGVPRGFSVESIISRIYAVNRGVIRPQYVGTEAVLQELRTRGFNLEAAMLSNEELGQLIIDVVSTGRPLDETRNLQFQKLLLQAGAQQSQIYPVTDRTLRDEFGREIKIRTHIENQPEYRALQGAN